MWQAIHDENVRKRIAAIIRATQEHMKTAAGRLAEIVPDMSAVSDAINELGEFRPWPFFFADETVSESFIEMMRGRTDAIFKMFEGAGNAVAERNRCLAEFSKIYALEKEALKSAKEYMAEVERREDLETLCDGLNAQTDDELDYHDAEDIVCAADIEDFLRGFISF